MKKIARFLMVLLILGSLVVPAYGSAESSLNDNELELIEYFRNGIWYEGVHYSVHNQYINQGINYLSQEGVDITDEQKKMIYDKVKEMTPEGIKQGYLVKDATKSVSNDAVTPGESQLTPTSEPSQQSDKGQDIEKTEEKTLNLTDKEKINKRENSTDSSDSTSHEGKLKTIPELIESVKDLSDDLGVKISFDAEKKNVSVVNNEGKKVMVADKIIKNTGFRLNQTFTVLAGLLLLTYICSKVAQKYHLFAHDDEA